MFRRRYMKCYCMNNDNNSCDKSMIEDKCQNVYNYTDYDDDNCECGFEDEEMSVFPENPMLAQSYVPIQYMDKTFRPEVGLKMGTIFPELVSPYMPCQSMREIAYLERRNEIGEGCNDER